MKSRSMVRVWWWLMLAGMVPVQGIAQDLVECARVDDDDARLRCYDQVAGRQPTPGPEVVPVVKPAALPDPAARDRHQAGDFVAYTREFSPDASPLAVKWELDDDTRYGVLRLRTHKPNYLLPWRGSTGINQNPQSPDHGQTMAAGGTDLNPNEAKYQFSFKSKLAQGLAGGRLDLWAAYTQQSNWQVYAESAPFRESNYEPEVMAVLHTDRDVLGLRMRFVNFGLVHQSNGRGGALSRGWNRVYAQFGLERGNFAVMVRPWYELTGGDNRDNRDISDYMGYGDVLAVYQAGHHSFAALVRNNLKSSDNRGALQLDWRFPLYRNLKGYLQFFTGYGETMIDYNYRQDVIGIGISLSDWM